MARQNSSKLVLKFASMVLSAAMLMALAAITLNSRTDVGRMVLHLGSIMKTMEDHLSSTATRPERAEELFWFVSYRNQPEKLKNPPDVLLGSYDGKLPATLDGLHQIEQSIGVNMPLIHLYLKWGERETSGFPDALLNEIWQKGSVPVITWEPTLSEFDGEQSEASDRDRNGMRAISTGAYDSYLKPWALAAARFDRPLFIRFAPGMNETERYPWGAQNNSAEDYVAAYRHIVDMFRDAGADRVLWVWSPRAAIEGYEAFYPGDDVVDWVGTSALNYGSVLEEGQWTSFQDVFGIRYARLADFGKPVMITEFGSVSSGGDRRTWYSEALTGLPGRFPAVRAVLFFHTDRDAVGPVAAVNWTFSNEAAVAKSISEAIRPWAAEGRR